MEPPRRLRAGLGALLQLAVAVALCQLAPCAAVDATVNAGANQVHGISFGLLDRTAAENAAREAAGLPA